MKIPNQFQVMLVKDKKPLAPWKELTEREQTPEEKAKVLEVAQPGTLGIVTGSISRLFVLDIDGAEGEKAIEKLHIPRTPKVRTPHGCHYYFRWTDELDGRVTTRAGVFNKVDVRGDGGYVAFYGWSIPPTVVPFASPPNWLIDALPKKESRQITAGPMATLDGIREGNRNQSFASLAGGLRARGYTTDVIFELLRPKAREVNFPESELMVVCQSIGRYDAPKIDDESTSFKEFIADTKPVKWIAPGLIPEAAIGFVAGLPESIKTWMLIDLAIEFARGGFWLGRFPTEQNRVLYLDQEREKDETGRRFKALIAGKELSAESLEGRLAVKCGTTFRLNLPKSREKLERILGTFQPGVVVVDSFKTFHTKNELASFDMQEVMNVVKELRTKYHCAFLFVHHETKGVHQRRKEGADVSYLDASGTIDLPQTAEVFFNSVSRGPGESMLYHTKATQGTKLAPLLVKVSDVVPDRSIIKVEAF